MAFFLSKQASTVKREHKETLSCCDICKMETRKKSSVYLLGSCEPEILGAKLPSYRQAFGHFLYLHKEKKKTIRDASAGAIQAVAAFWEKAGIPVKPPQHSMKKLEKTFKKWKCLQKHKSRKSETHRKQEETFIERLEDLFDIAHENALALIKNPEDRSFLLSQRQKGRPGCIGSLDQIHNQRSIRTEKRLHAQQSRKIRSDTEITNVSSRVQLSSSSVSSSTSTDDDVEHGVDRSHENLAVNEGAAVAEEGASSHKRAKINVMTPGLCAALDRTMTSSRNATYIISEVAGSLGCDVNSLNINRSSIHRRREINRESTAKKLKAEFPSTGALVVHWDGKLMEDLTNREHVDRLPVLVSSVGFEQLLGVPKLNSGTGVAQADAIIQCLEEWNIVQRVAALSFDTTASNTGRHLGTCVLLQQKLEKNLLFLACRHHIFELIVGSVFDNVLGVSSGPEILIFKRFRMQWMSMDKTRFETASTDPTTERMVSSYRTDIVKFAKENLTMNRCKVRDDYREFLELAIIFLGGAPPRGIRFNSPGAMHRARWMAKVLYALKMWLFRAQFKMTVFELNGIRDVAIFAVTVHLKAWMRAPLAVEAPFNDFELMRQLLDYPQSNISKVSSKKLGLHLWYLSAELVTLSLFDSRIPLKSKRLMVAAMDKEAPEQPPKCPRIDVSSFSSPRHLEQFFTTNSKTLFNLLCLPDAFLKKDPREWKRDQSYQDAERIVKSLAVTNDRAERGVALIKELNCNLTKKEEQLQYLTQVVADHRKQFRKSLKRDLLKK